MRLATKHLMQIGAVLALSAVSASSFAQSNEYRRGYDAGYAAGMRAAQDDRGGRPGGRNRLHIEQADYGARGAMCDARQAVRQEAERNGGNVIAGNQLCGDPARNVQKRLSVVYLYGDSEPLRVQARENETLNLSCRR